MIYLSAVIINQKISRASKINDQNVLGRKKNSYQKNQAARL